VAGISEGGGVETGVQAIPRPAPRTNVGADSDDDIPSGGGLVITSDPDDILALAAAAPEARIRVVAPT